MGYFRSEGGSGFGGRGRSGGSRFGGGSRGGFRDREGGFERRVVEMHDATCDKCKKQCQVPFRPTSGKPVFCSNCFKSEGSSNSFGSRDRGRPSFSRAPSAAMPSDQLVKINGKLDKILNILSTLEIADEDAELTETLNGTGDESEEAEDGSEKEDDGKILVKDESETGSDEEESDDDLNDDDDDNDDSEDKTETK